MTELQLLVDRLAVQDLADRYLSGLDDAEFDEDWARSIFTEDGRFEFAMGGHHGVVGMAEFTAAMMGKWRRTHHVAAGHLVEIDGDRARVRGNLIATHLHAQEAAEPFQVGDRFAGDAVRTDAGWRFTAARVRGDLEPWHAAGACRHRPQLRAFTCGSCSRSRR